MPFPTDPQYVSWPTNDTPVEQQFLLYGLGTLSEQLGLILDELRKLNGPAVDAES